MDSLHGSLSELVNHVGDVDDVIMTIQPSDDCFHKEYVDTVQTIFREKDVNLVAPKRGYLMNYNTLELKEYNPETNPPFFSIRFKKDVFIDPFRHAKWTGPYQSHEYAPEHITPVYPVEGRVFLVGTHGENVSTHFDHPYGQNEVNIAMLREFGLEHAQPMKLRYSIRKQIMRRLPHGWRRKLRYYCGELFAQKVYNFLRN
jgi:hypothetical protein